MAVKQYGPPVFRTLDGVRDYLLRRDYQLFNLTIDGADGVALEFMAPVKISLDVNGVPRALLYQGSALVLYDAADPPAAGKWYLRRNQQTVVMGTPPLAGEPFLFIELWGVP
jgi:predicted type IV restriction endonuclease